MASKIPSPAAQCGAIADILDDEEGNADLDAIGVAARIRREFLKMWQVDIEDASVPVKEGLAFKVPWDASKVYHAAWIGPEYASGDSRTLAWVIDATSDYGAIVDLKSRMWAVTTPSTGKAGGAGNNKDGWKKGDIVSLNQRMHSFEILQTGNKTVLMRNKDTGYLQVDSNANLKRYYTKESK